MNLKHLILMSCLVSSTLGVAQSANAQERTKTDTNREVLYTYSRIYFDQKNYVGIENLITPYLKQDSDDAILWNYLGLAQMELARFPQACQSLERSKSLMKPSDDRTEILFNLADCYNRQKRDRESMAELNTLVAVGNDYSFSASRIIDLMQRGSIRPGHSLPKLTRAAEKGRYLLSGAVAVGFDTNVLLLEESVMSATAISDRGSFFVSPVVQAGYEGKLWDNRFEARYLASFTDYLSSAVNSFNSLYQRADFRIGSGPIQWGLFTDVLFLNRSPFQLYNYDIGASWYHRKAIDATHSWAFEIPVRYQKFLLDSTSSAENDRTGGQFELRAIYRALRGDGIGSFTATFSLENQYTLGRNYRLTGINIPINYTVSLPGFSSLNLINTFSAELNGDFYWQSDLNRRDATVRAGAGVIRKFMGSWSASVDYSYFKNVSTTSLARYSKNIYSLLVSHDF